MHNHHHQSTTPPPLVHNRKKKKNPKSPVKFNHAVGYFDDKYGGFGRSRSDLGSNLYGKRSEESPHYDSIRDEGRKVELYGARGTAPKSSTWAPTFDHYGRSIGFGSGKDSTVTSNSSKIVRAVPKAETQQDVKSGVQKLRVKLLPESSSEHHGCSLLGTTMTFSEWERGNVSEWERWNEGMNKKRTVWNKKLLFCFCSKLQCTSIYRCAL